MHILFLSKTSVHLKALEMHWLFFKYVNYEKLQSIKVTLNHGNDYLGFKKMELIMERIDYSNSFYVEETVMRPILHVSHTIREEGPIIWQRITKKEGTFNWRTSSYPDFIRNYFLLKRTCLTFLIIAINAINQAFWEVMG